MQKISIIFVLATLLIATKSLGAISPIGISILPPVEFPPEDFTVAGVRASVLWGKHRHVYGIDIGGLGNMSDLEGGGLAIAGGFNYTQGQNFFIPGQIAGITNYNKQKITVVGVQATVGVNNNEADSGIIGVQVGAVANLNPHTSIYGVEVGIYNKANEIYGLQIGVVNIADSVHGLQIGLINFHEKGVFKVCPILNFGF